jgi:hypothetical protein
MKHATLFAVGILSISLGLSDSARCQNSRAPLSLTQPGPNDEIPIIRASPPEVADEAPPPKVSGKRLAPPVTSRTAAPPKPAADYDGFSVSVDHDPVAKLPLSPRTDNRSKSRKEPSPGEITNPAEDEQLRRKLTICRDCK